MNIQAPSNQGISLKPMRRYVWHIGMVVFLVALVAISHQMVSLRYQAVVGWLDLSFYQVALSILGFGFSGIFIHFLRTTIKRNYFPILTLALLLGALSFPIHHEMIQRIDFDGNLLGYDVSQWLIFGLDVFLGIVPTFFMGLVIGMGFLKVRSSLLLGIMLLSGGVGCAVPSLLYSYWSYDLIPFLFSGVLILASILGLFFRIHWKYLLSVAFVIALVSGFFVLLPPSVSITPNPHKELSKLFQDASYSLIEETSNASGLLHHFSAKSAWDSKVHSPQENRAFYPSWKTHPASWLVLDLGVPIPLWHPFDWDVASQWVLDNDSSLLGYVLVPPSQRKNALILGMKTGIAMDKAQRCGYETVDVVEENKNRLDTYVKSPKTPISLEKAEQTVQIHYDAIRNFCQSDSKQYDIVDFGEVEMDESLALGLFSYRSSYLLTAEAIASYLTRLKPDGIFTITHRIKDPPQKIFKVFSTILLALRHIGIHSYAEYHIVIITQGNQATIMVSPTAFPQSWILKIKRLQWIIDFEILYYPLIRSQEVHSYQDSLLKSIFEGVQHMLNPHRRALFFKTEAFDIHPIYDNRPFYFNRFRLNSFNYFAEHPLLIPPFKEWGSFAFMLITIPLVLVSILILIIPMVVGRHRFGLNAKTWAHLTYFFFIGIGMVIVQTMVVQKGLLFIGLPVFGGILVLGILLGSMALGSLFSYQIYRVGVRLLTGAIRYSKVYKINLIRLHPMYWPTFFLIAFSMIFFLVMDQLPYIFPANPLGIRILLFSIVTVPLGFCLSMPFTLGMQRTQDNEATRVPWTWGITGFGMAVAVFFANWLAILYGFLWVLLIGFLFFLFAFIVDCLGGQPIRFTER